MIVESQAPNGFLPLEKHRLIWKQLQKYFKMRLSAMRLKSCWCHGYTLISTACLSTVQAASSVIFRLLSILSFIVRLSLPWWLMTFSYVCQGWFLCCPSVSLHWVSSETLKVPSLLTPRIIPQALDNMWDTASSISTTDCVTWRET